MNSNSAFPTNSPPTFHTFSLDDICRAKTIPVEIKDDSGNIEGIVYLKEPSAIDGVKLQESITAELPWHELVMGILALTLSDASGSPLVNSPTDRKKLEAMPPRMLVALRDPCLAMLSMSWSTKEVIATDTEDIDATLANLDDQVAQVYVPGEISKAVEELGIAVPIDGNENLHLDQDLDNSTTSSGSAVDPTNPFVETAEEPS